MNKEQNVNNEAHKRKLEQTFRGNAGFFIPITELHHFITGLNDQQQVDLDRSIQILTTEQQPENKIFFLGELAIMPSPPYARTGLFENTSEPNNNKADTAAPKYNIPRDSLNLINKLMEKNGFHYGVSTSYPSNGWRSMTDIKRKTQPSGVRRSDAVRDYLIKHFGSDEQRQGIKSQSTPSIVAPESRRLKLEFNISGQYETFFKNAEHITQLTKHADNPIKLLITKAFLRAIKSDIPTDVMHKTHFLDNNQKPIEFSVQGDILTVHIGLSNTFAGFVKDNIAGHAKKFEAAQQNIGREVALAISVQKNAQTLKIAA